MPPADGQTKIGRTNPGPAGMALLLDLALAGGGMRQADLARQRGISGSAVHTTAERLERRGLVAIERLPKRAVVYELTDDGFRVAAGERVLQGAVEDDEDLLPVRRTAPATVCRQDPVVCWPPAGANPAMVA